MSGDSQRVVQAVAAEIGVPLENALGGLTPQDKSEKLVCGDLLRGHPAP